MGNKDRILWITRTAIFIALLIVVQTFSRPLGQYITGSLVNLILITAVMLCGLPSSCTVALLSPAFAFFLGIGPVFPPILPFVMLGNLSLILVWHVIAGRTKVNKRFLSYLISIIGGATIKFLVLYFGIVKLAVPILLTLPDKQVVVLSASFSLPQFFTALIGGVIAAIILPQLQKVFQLHQ